MTAIGPNRKRMLHRTIQDRAEEEAIHIPREALARQAYENLSSKTPATASPPASGRSVMLSPPASDVEGPTDRDRVGLCFETEIPRRAFDLHMAQKRSNRLQIASAFQNVESLRPTQGFDAIGPGIESCLDHPDLQQTGQLPRAQWTTARRVTARE
jgi:hypothetical protein